MLVQDIMQRQVITVTPQTSLKEVGRLIFGNRINALPVVDFQNKLVGIITDKDFIKHLYPSYNEYIDDYIHARNFDEMEDKARELMSLSAIDIMRKNLITILPDTPILKAASSMIVRRVNQLPVVRDGILVGIISHGDIFRSIVAKDLPFWRKVELYNRFAHHYDVLMRWEKRVPLELPFILKKLNSIKAKNILDIGCGTGEHDLALAREGYRITGIDVSREMIGIAKEKVEKENKKISSKIEFIHTSMGNIEKNINKKYDAIICLGNTLAHTSNLLIDLKDMAQSLKSGGIFILQIRNYEKIIKSGSRLLDVDFRQRNEDLTKELAFVRFVDFRSDGKLNFNILTMARGQKGWKSWGIESVTQLPITMEMLEKALKETGFIRYQWFGAFDSNIAFHPVKSSDLVVTALKR